MNFIIEKAVKSFTIDNITYNKGEYYGISGLGNRDPIRAYIFKIDDNYRKLAWSIRKQRIDQIEAYMTYHSIPDPDYEMVMNSIVPTCINSNEVEPDGYDQYGFCSALLYYGLI